MRSCATPRWERGRVQPIDGCIGGCQIQERSGSKVAPEGTTTFARCNISSTPVPISVPVTTEGKRRSK